MFLRNLDFYFLFLSNFGMIFMLKFTKKLSIKTQAKVRYKDDFRNAGVFLTYNL